MVMLLNSDGMFQTCNCESGEYCEFDDNTDESVCSQCTVISNSEFPTQSHM